MSESKGLTKDTDWTMDHMIEGQKVHYSYSITGILNSVSRIHGTKGIWITPWNNQSESEDDGLTTMTAGIIRDGETEVGIIVATRPVDVPDIQEAWQERPKD